METTCETPDVALARRLTHLASQLRGSPPPRYLYWVLWKNPIDDLPLSDSFYRRKDAQTFVNALDDDQIEHSPIEKAED